MIDTTTEIVMTTGIGGIGTHTETEEEETVEEADAAAVAAEGKLILSSSIVDNGVTHTYRDTGNERDKRYSTCLFVGNLPYHFRERDLSDYFGRCGRIRNITVGLNKTNNQSKGYAFVDFEDRRDAEDAFDKYVLLVQLIIFLSNSCILGTKVTLSKEES